MAEPHYYEFYERAGLSLDFIDYGMENAQPLLLCDAALSARADTGGALGHI